MSLILILKGQLFKVFYSLAKEKLSNILIYLKSRTLNPKAAVVSFLVILSKIESKSEPANILCTGIILCWHKLGCSWGRLAQMDNS